MNARRWICALTTMAMLGCTSMRPLQGDLAELPGRLEPGDQLVVYERSGRIIEMTLTTVDGQALRGGLKDHPGQTVTVDIADIERIEIEKIDTGKTVLAGIGTAVVVLPLIAIAALASGALVIPPAL